MSTRPEYVRTGRSELAAFRRVVCGIDGSPDAEEAVREASLLAPDGAHLALVDVIVPGISENVAAMVPGSAAVQADARRKVARSEVDHARLAVPLRISVSSAILVGPPAPLLLAEADRIGRCRRGREPRGRQGYRSRTWERRDSRDPSIRLLSIVARAGLGFPRSIAVGVDGSDPSLRALDSGRDLASRIGVPLRVLHVGDGTVVPDSVQTDLDDGVEEIRGGPSPADGLSSRVTEADLLVVGSRGLRGLRALGSVSESVAHRAPASVLDSQVRAAQPCGTPGREPERGVGFDRSRLTGDLRAAATGAGGRRCRRRVDPELPGPGDVGVGPSGPQRHHRNDPAQSVRWPSYGHS